MAVRTRFFDDFFLECDGSGIRQAVILASGLDARAYRLRWPAGTVVYEIDQPKVIEFKNATMASIGAEPTATRRAVSIDLREDWPAALRRNGFDDSKPTAWSAEGLLVYLPPDAQDRLFDDIAALVGAGQPARHRVPPGRGRQHGPAGGGLPVSGGRKHGFDMNLADLFYPGERNPVVDYLTDHGWQVTARNRPEMFAEYGRDTSRRRRARTDAGLARRHRNTTVGRQWHAPTTTPGIWPRALAPPPPMVAAQRVLADREGLIDDPFAEPLVRAVGLDFFTRRSTASRSRGRRSPVQPASAPQRAWLSAPGISTGCSPTRPTQACGRRSFWPPDWTPAPTGCRGPTEPSSTRSTSPR